MDSYICISSSLYLKRFYVLLDLGGLQLQVVDIGSLSRGRHRGVAGGGGQRRALVTHQRGRGTQQTPASVRQVIAGARASVTSESVRRVRSGTPLMSSSVMTPTHARAAPSPLVIAATAIRAPVGTHQRSRRCS